MTTRDSLLAVLVTVIWGLNFVVIDEGLAGFPPLLFVALRFVVVLIPAVFLLPRPDLPWRTLLLVGSFLSLGQFALLYASLHAGMPAGLASLVLQTQVVATVVIAAGVLHERPSVRAGIGVGMGAAGLAVVALGRSAETPLIGLTLCILAALSWATGNVLARRAAVKSGLSLTVWSAIVVPVPMVALSLIMDGPAAVGHALTHITLGNIASTLYTAVLASLVGYGIWNTLLAKYTAAQVVPFTLLVPVVGLISAALVQNEEPSFYELLGGLILLLGVAVVAIRWPLRRASEPPAVPEAGAVRPEDDSGPQVRANSPRRLTL
ncbi:EamA family transporter [Kineosporia babensis]|uniref:EamA family transporter n=1 Tax=Kineosporia babensis TaxID=499548 RepID=A0A9X1SU97_9ACTN|nr:EamA family transporter [Kineosporia babensis]